MRALSDLLNGVAEALVMALVAAITATMSWGVFSRFVLHTPLAWSEELSRYLFVWLSFLGASVAFRRGLHLGMEALVNRLPKELRRALRVCGLLAVLGVLGVVCVTGAQLALFVMPQRSPAMGISMGGPYLAVPVGSALMVVHAVADLVELWRGDPG
jgi:TRAP-type C4-dicarboxylate transport system permease small subunit